MLRTDPTFAEICRDYDTLVRLLPRDAGDPALPDIQASLAALEDELRTILQPQNRR